MNTLIVKTSSLGDVVQTFPVVEYLKQRQNVQKVGWVVEKRVAPLVKAHPLVDTVIEIDTRALRSLFLRPGLFRAFHEFKQLIQQDYWELLFDLQGNCKSALVSYLARSMHKVGYGKKTVPEWLNTFATSIQYDAPTGLSVRDEYLFFPQQFFKDQRPFESHPIELKLTPEEEVLVAKEMARLPHDTPIWFLSVGSNWPNKMCESKTLLDLFKLINERYKPYFVFITGTSQELKEVAHFAQEFRSHSHVLFQQPLPVLQRLLNRAQAVLALDSLVLHLAGTTNAPTFGFFGPSSALKYAPRGMQHGFYQGRCSFNQHFERRCPLLRTCPFGSCLKDAEAHELFEAIVSWQNKIVK